MVDDRLRVVNTSAQSSREPWLERLNPLRDGTPDEARAGRLVLLLALIVGGAATAYEALYIAMQMWFTVVTVAIGISLAFGVPLWFRRRPSVPAAAHTLAVAAFIALAGVTWQTGGLQSVAIGWFLIAPMLAALVNGRRAGLVWVGATVAWMSFLYLLELAGHTPTNEMPVAVRGLFAFVAPAGLVGCVFAFVWSYELSREEAMEKLCEARDDATREHEHARAVLDNVGEGLVLVREDGRLQPARSAALERWFGKPSNDAHVWDVFRAHDADIAEQVEIGWEQLGTGWLPRDVALEQLPTRLVTDDQVLQLHWSPAGSDGEVMLMATDVTAQLHAEEERREQEELVNILSRLGRSRQQVLDFASDARRIVDALLAREGDRAQERRWIHTLKGNTAVMGLGRLAEWLHALETKLEDEQRQADDEERRELARSWTRFESRISEMVGTDDQDSVRVRSSELGHTIGLVASGEPRKHIVTRMESWTWDDAHSRLKHLAEQAKRLAHRMDKSVDVVVEANVRTPPTRAWRELWGSLVHLVRNAVDHGIEFDRAAVGKSSAGTIALRAERAGHVVRIEISDDGAGIDWTKIERNAREHGRSLVTDADRAAWLLSDGVSSRDKVSEISGRGVGTAAVREVVAALGGMIHIESEQGRFTRFVLSVPLECADVDHRARSA